MNKVASYLQGHVLGEVSTRADEREKLSRDQSILAVKPEMVVYPRNTNDIRKSARLAWQLAEKGHALNITVSGEGQGQSGSSIGRGINLVTSRHLRRIFEYEPKQKLVRLQPGVNVKTLEAALRMHATAIPALPDTGTVGAAVANDADSRLSDKFGTMSNWVDKLEVVLASGEVIQTGRISKRELDKRKGLQGREGDIYRGIDAILDDHEEFIKDLAESDSRDRSGYAGIAKVRAKSGSFDLTPLFVGSQGTLGVIGEMILKSEFMPLETACGVALFDDSEVARDALDELRKVDFSYLEYYDGAFLHTALDQGKEYTFLDKNLEQTQAILMFGFSGFGERTQKKQLKKVSKILSKQSATKVITTEDVDKDQIESLFYLPEFTHRPTGHIDRGASALIPGCYVPAERLEEFIKDLNEVGSKLHISLPIYGSALRSLYTIRPTLSLQKVSDKQKALKVIDQVAALVVKHGGHLVARDGEGRLLSRFARADWSDEYAEIVQKIRTVFDPYKILNSGVKTEVELKDLIADLRGDNSF